MEHSLFGITLIIIFLFFAVYWDHERAFKNLSEEMMERKDLNNDEWREIFDARHLKLCKKCVSSFATAIQIATLLLGLAAIGYVLDLTRHWFKW